ncbi:MAG: type II toxin-antitoxin system prevent-host-death family antitoxin [Bifidobacterium crudilactis]|nr:type II toxin-antitoxin system prevent-host-death family antitoxin [Bifidobacterium crudilactis]
MRRLHDDADVMLVTNRDPNDNVVVMSQDDYDSLMETLRVQSNPDLNRRVMEGMQQTADGVEEEYDEL